ncbi:ester cyclase [Amycolatopsis sp. cmx-11-32]|uniref:ester cyclase n=1 Tax=Amycolatopsis sp. cmx-11-32 TaxID=2785796 RepID=UPI0039E5A590
MTDPKKLHVHFVEEVWTKFNIDVVDEVVHETFVGHDPIAKDVHGPAEFKLFLQMMLTSFPDQTMDIHDVIQEGNRTALRWHSVGTHTRNELFGIRPAGRRFATYGLTFIDWSGGRMRELWFGYDLNNVLRQLA